MVNGGREMAQGGLEAAAAQGGGEGAEDGRAGDGGQRRPAEGVEAIRHMGQRRLGDASQTRPRGQIRLLPHIKHRRHPRQSPRDLRLVLPDRAGRVGGEEEDGGEGEHEGMVAWVVNSAKCKKGCSATISDGAVCGFWFWDTCENMI